MLGDFNLVEDAIDRLPCKADDPQATNTLRNFKLRHNLVDGWRMANPEEKGYTWIRDSDGTQSRLDRIYIHEDFFNESKDWQICQPPIPTDHDIVSAKIATPTTPRIGKGRWAIPPRVLKNKIIKDEIQKLGKTLENELRKNTPRTQRRNPQTLLRNFKIKISELARAHERITQPILRKKIEDLSNKLKTIRNSTALPQDEIQISSTQIKKEIQKIFKDSHQHNRNNSAAIDAAEGEQIGKTWSNRYKNTHPRDTIKRLKNPHTNETTDISKEMADIAATHHREIQYNDHKPTAHPNRAKLDKILSPVKAKLSNHSIELLKKSISEEDVLKALKKSSNDKAPGLDGIPVELWKLLNDQYTSAKKNDDDIDNKKKKCNIIWILTQVFKDIESHGTDTNAKFNEGCVSPIYKKKDPENIANYRPITLLNTDYKIFTKALSIKLAAAAPEIINTDQAGFIQGRSIFDQVKTTKLVIDYMEKTNKPGAIVALDQEKAYDKILHPYLWEVLRKFKFPEEFIKTTQALYDNATSIVMINGELSDPFKILRGVRQGDALSCLLFNIAIEPLAENIRRSERLKGITIPGTNKCLKVKLFADDTTVILSDKDNIEDLHKILTDWCDVSGAKFNIEKTEIIPLGNKLQREHIIASRKLNAESEEFPEHINIAKEGEPVRILGAWLGNHIDQAITWAPIVENVQKRLRKWSAAKHSLEGRRLIVQMQIAGVTQYLTKVQGMPKSVENDLNNLIRKFMWNYEKIDSINQSQMHAPHKKGGKKLLDIEARNKAIHLTWLKTYLNFGSDRPTWTFFADAIICTDIPEYHQIDKDPESRIMPIAQSWETRTRNSSLPEDLKTMLKLAKEYNVRIDALNPTDNTKLDLPIWYHIHSAPAARKLYKTKPAKCLRSKHKVKLVRDTLLLLEQIPIDHVDKTNCTCMFCRQARQSIMCHHPHACLKSATLLIKLIHRKWNPANTRTERTEPTQHPAQRPAQNVPQQGTEGNAECNTRTFDKSKETADLKEAVRIFNEPFTPTGPIPTNATTPPRRPEEVTVYTDGACINNGDENAATGFRIWYRDQDPRNKSMRVPILNQSNQTGELLAVLTAVREHPPQDNLLIVTDSKYVIDGLTKNLKKWEERNWIDTCHGHLFKCTAAWMRRRSGKTTLKWIKGHSGIKGNEEADRLAGEGALKPLPADRSPPYLPPDYTPTGAALAKLEQKDLYKIITDMKRIPVRSRTERIIAEVKTCSQDQFGRLPTSEAIWTATKHKDFTRKTRDFIWKSTQHAYKIGDYWFPIEGFQDRGVCPICNENEDMDHILTKCKANARKLTWDLACTIWKKKYSSALPLKLGDILGCGLAHFMRNNKPDTGKNRLYRILVSETAFLIWKLRNERRIKNNDTTEDTPHQEVENRWTNAINKRLTIDRFLTDRRRFGNKALDDKLVKATWSNCLKNEESLPSDWVKRKGVLVGISRPVP